MIQSTETAHRTDAQPSPHRHYRVLYWQSTSQSLGYGSYRSLLDTVDAAAHLGHLTGLIVARIQPPYALRPRGDVSFADWPDNGFRQAGRYVYVRLLARSSHYGLRFTHTRKLIFHKKLRRFRTLVDQFQPQIAHLSQQLESDIVLLREAVRRGMPVVQHFRASPSPWLDPNDVDFFNHHHIRGIATSGFNRQAWIAAGLRSDLIELIPPLIEPARRSLKEENKRSKIATAEKTVLFVGRLVPEKAPDLVIDAFARAAGKGWRLQILGRGELEGALLKQVRRLGLETQVEFVKHSDDPGSYYERADIVMLPNFYEVFGRTTVEAMYWGKPVITSDTGGSREIIDHLNTGVRVASKDADAWASVLSELQSDSQMRERLGRNAAIAAQVYFDREKHVEALCRVYESVITR